LCLRASELSKLCKGDRLRRRLPAEFFYREKVRPIRAVILFFLTGSPRRTTRLVSRASCHNTLPSGIVFNTKAVVMMSMTLLPDFVACEPIRASNASLCLTAVCRATELRLIGHATLAMPTAAKMAAFVHR